MPSCWCEANGLTYWEVVKVFIARTVPGVPEHLRASADGRIAEFEAHDSSGNVWTSGKTVGIVRRFKVPLAFVEEMLKATNVVMEIRTSTGTKQEGTLVNGSNMAKPGFRKALEKIRKPD
jgi:uncharacterized Zn ribbon protein